MRDKKQLALIIVSIASLVLSICAIFISLNRQEEPKETIVEKTPEAIKQEKLDSVANIIHTILDKERIYQSVAFHPLATKTEAANAALNFRTEVVKGLSLIADLVSEEELASLNDELLMQFAKFENEYGEKSRAAKTYEYIIEVSDQLVLKEQAIDQLAVIYADRSSLLFNPEKVRVLQKQILNREKKKQSKDRYERLSTLYEDWAKTEYIQLRDQDYGNKVLDSAFYCVRRLPDYLIYKDSLLQRLTAIYNYHNNVLTPDNIPGNYKFYVNNVGAGTATIASSNDVLSIRIDYLDNEKLMGQITGSGKFLDKETMVFDISLKSYSDKFESFRDGKGTLELKTAANYLLKGTLKEFGKDPVELRLLKNPD
ncbi:hypothetical protein ACJD0Z_04760 [Flavobacteriaceae bacterium M23B6Z8]